MTVNYKILRSDKDEIDIIKVKHNDKQDALNKLEPYLASLDVDYQVILPMLAVWATHDNAPCGYYKNILQLETPQGAQAIIQVKRIKPSKK